MAGGSMSARAFIDACPIHRASFKCGPRDYTVLVFLGLWISAPKRTSIQSVLRKEVIQPQVPLRLPCYDFTPVADLTVAGCLLKG